VFQRLSKRDYVKGDIIIYLHRCFSGLQKFALPAYSASALRIPSEISLKDDHMSVNYPGHAESLRRGWQRRHSRRKCERGIRCLFPNFKHITFWPLPKKKQNKGFVYCKEGSTKLCGLGNTPNWKIKSLDISISSKNPPLLQCAT
jgi:hypothetical protein